MEWLKELFVEHSALQAVVVVSLISTIGIGLGKIRFFGISLGTAFIFFVGILAGHFGLSLDPAMLTYAESFGLVIFVYALGLQVGPGFFSSMRADGLRLVSPAIAIVLLVINLGFRNHDPAKLWVNQMKRRARRVALVYPAGVPAAEKWLKAQKKSLEQEFAKTEEYALPKGTPAEETAELVASLKAREDLSEVRQPKAGR